MEINYYEYKTFATHFQDPVCVNIYVLFESCNTAFRICIKLCSHDSTEQKHAMINFNICFVAYSLLEQKLLQVFN